MLNDFKVRKFPQTNFPKILDFACRNYFPALFIFTCYNCKHKIYQKTCGFQVRVSGIRMVLFHCCNNGWNKNVTSVCTLKDASGLLQGWGANPLGVIMSSILLAELFTGNYKLQEERFGGKAPLKIRKISSQRRIFARKFFSITDFDSFLTSNINTKLQQNCLKYTHISI